MKEIENLFEKLGVIGPKSKFFRMENASIGWRAEQTGAIQAYLGSMDV